MLPLSLAAQQNADQEQPAAAAPPLNASALVTVHGVVRNVTTGEPIPRALVRIEGDAAAGALTDGDGKFEISGLPAGPELFEIVKPGYFDRPASAPANFAQDGAVSPHNIIVSPEMKDIAFTLAPACTIHGEVTLSTGDSAQGIPVMLLKRGVQEGRGVWQQAASTRTLSDGSYRFSGLTDGVYIVYTLPAMDSDSAANLIAAGRARNVVSDGFPTVFYPDARDLAGATKIRVSNGEQFQANLTLAIEPFHAVSAKAVSPDRGPGNTLSPQEGASANYQAVVTDAQGHRLPYSAQYDQSTHSIQTMLPDGTYSLFLSASSHLGVRFGAGSDLRAFALNFEPQVGSTEFTVAGHAIQNLRIPVAVPRTNPIQFAVNHSASPSVQPVSQDRNPLEVVVTASEAGGWMTDGMSSNFAQGNAPGAVETTYTSPGLYWVHTHFAQRGLCESSFTAGGADLAREPLTIGVSGSTAPLELTARDDCAKLTLSLPASITAMTAGEEPFFAVYVVPDFDITTDIEPVVLRPTSGSSFSLENLTPGNYHVYSFTTPVSLEYRNHDVLASLPNPGQSITLSPGATTSLTLEAPEQ